MDKVIVLLTGISAIGFVYWFFLMKKDQEVSVNKEITITVSGGYSPERITIQNNKPITIHFLRTDKNSCLEEVVLPDFKIRKQLPLNEQVSIIVTPQKTGTFTYSCGMNMYHGKITVK